jgi:DNA-binding NarL/FixJ family response regulator
MTIRVLIADDHRLFRQGLISLMKTREDFVQVLGEAESGREAVQMVEQLRPDIVLLDIYMPDGNGLEAARAIRAKAPKTAIVVLTSSELDEHLNEAVKIGVDGYLLKNLDEEELFDLLAGIQKGEAAMTRTMAARVLKTMTTVNGNLLSGNELTEREVDVLRLVARGDSNIQIAAKLYISVNTVKTHIKNILSKLQLENRTQVAAYAAKAGLVAPEISEGSLLS